MNGLGAGNGNLTGSNEGDSQREFVRLKARRYFANPGFHRLLKEIWMRYASLERAGGNANVRHASREECDAINDFFGWYKKPGEDIRIPLSGFEQELMDSAFPYTIPELHEALTGKPLLTKSDQLLLSQREWRSLFDQTRELVVRDRNRLHPVVEGWLIELEAGEAFGYRTLKELIRGAAGSGAALPELVKAVTAWHLLLTGEAASLAGLLPGASIRLPVLAAIATGDAHALDRSQPAGRLLYQALAGRKYAEQGEAEAAENSEDSSHEWLAVHTLSVRQLYRDAGILDDDVSSIVHLYDRGQFWGTGMKLQVLTLRQVEENFVWPVVENIYIVENPSVFSTLIDADFSCTVDGRAGPGPHSLLMCISGPASAAALRLLDRLMESGSWRGSLFYAGDYDIKGIEIGNVIADRYKNKFIPWRFDSESYTEEFIHVLNGGVAFTGAEQVRLGKLNAVWDRGLTSVMALKGFKLFQEQLIAHLLEDWRKC